MHGGEKIRHRALERLVVLGEGAVHAVRSEEPAHALRFHDERRDRPWRSTAVRDIAGPLTARPPNDRPLWVPRSPLEIDRGPVVKDPPVGRPAECPARVQTDACRVIRVPTGRDITLFGVVAAVDPVSAGRSSIGPQRVKPGQLLALSYQGAVGQANVRQGVAVDLPGHGFSARVLERARRRYDRACRVEVPPKFDHWVGERSAFSLVQFLHFEMNVRGDLDLVLRFAVRSHGSVEPLDPASCVGLRSVPLERSRRRNQEDLGLYLLRVDAGVAHLLPDRCRLALVEVVDHEEVQVPHRLAFESGVGSTHGGVLTHQPQAFHDAPVHLVEDRDVIVAILDPLVDRIAFELWQVVVREAVIRTGRIAPPGFQQAGGEGRGVLPIVQGPWAAVRRLDLRRCDRPQVVVPGPLARRGHRQVTRQDMVEDGVVGGALHIGVAAQRVDAAPPALPMLPSSSCTIPSMRMFCTPLVCWVCPMAYMTEPALSGAPVSLNVS